MIDTEGISPSLELHSCSVLIGTSGGKKKSLLKLPEGFLSYSCEDKSVLEITVGMSQKAVVMALAATSVPMVSQGIPFAIVYLQISSELDFILPLCYGNYFCTGTLKKKKKSNYSIKTNRTMGNGCLSSSNKKVLCGKLWYNRRCVLFTRWIDNMNNDLFIGKTGKNSKRKTSFKLFTDLAV